MERRFIEDFLICPYDNTHVIRPLRMPYHLIKCRKNFPTLEMAVCPFNAIHEVKKPELRYHMINCPDKVILERTFQLDVLLTYGNSQLKGYTGVPRAVKHAAEPDEEYWDADVSYETDSPLPVEENVVPRRPRRRELETLRQPLSLPSSACITNPGQSDKSPQEAAHAQKERKGRGIPCLYQYSPASVPVVGRGRGLTFHLEKT